MATTVRVVTGNPSAAELAAVTAVLTARMAAAPADPPVAPRRAWDDPGLRLGVTRCWRDTTLPR